jgi:hypothetical protein
MIKAFALILTVMAAVATASILPQPQFRVNIDEGVITLSDVNDGTVLGKTTFERWEVVAPTQDKLRHVHSCTTEEPARGYAEDLEIFCVKPRITQASRIGTVEAAVPCQAVASCAGWSASLAGC